MQAGHNIEPENQSMKRAFAISLLACSLLMYGCANRITYHYTWNSGASESMEAQSVGRLLSRMDSLCQSYGLKQQTSSSLGKNNEFPRIERVYILQPTAQRSVFCSTIIEQTRKGVVVHVGTDGSIASETWAQPFLDEIARVMESIAGVGRIERYTEKSSGIK
jgi:hypothetical protein